MQHIGHSLRGGHTVHLCQRVGVEEEELAVLIGRNETDRRHTLTTVEDDVGHEVQGQYLGAGAEADESGQRESPLIGDVVTEDGHGTAVHHVGIVEVNVHLSRGVVFAEQGHNNAAGDLVLVTAVGRLGQHRGGNVGRDRLLLIPDGIGLHIFLRAVVSVAVPRAVVVGSHAEDDDGQVGRRMDGLGTGVAQSELKTLEGDAAEGRVEVFIRRLEVLHQCAEQFRRGRHDEVLHSGGDHGRGIVLRHGLLLCVTGYRDLKLTSVSETSFIPKPAAMALN